MRCSLVLVDLRETLGMEQPATLPCKTYKYSTPGSYCYGKYETIFVEYPAILAYWLYGRPIASSAQSSRINFIEMPQRQQETGRSGEGSTHGAISVQIQLYSSYSYSYPLVNIQKAMDNHHFQWENQLFLWPCSIAMLVYRRL